MKDRISIHVEASHITIDYESEYVGQIAPHTRNMMDYDADSLLTACEVANFFARYKQALNQTLQTSPFFVNHQPVTLELRDISAPLILTDSLLAPFNILMTFTIHNLKIVPGPNELMIDPKLLFIAGDQFIKMAKELVQFTDEQEKAIARFLEIKIFAADNILFNSTYPGYIKKDKKSVHIYGVFYDDTILKIQQSQYPKLKINFTLFE